MGAAMNCSACGYPMIGLDNTKLCPECGCGLPPVPAEALRTAERRAQCGAVIFVVAIAVLQTILIDIAPPLVLALWALQAVAAMFVAVQVVSASTRRRFWRSLVAKAIAALGVWLTLALAPFALACLLFIGWVAIR